MNIRSRNDLYKTKIIDGFKKEVISGFDSKLKPIIDQKLNISWDDKGLEKVREGHKFIESNKNIGKVVLYFD